jgi:hypothetical protein
MKREVSLKTAFIVIAVAVLLVAGYGIYYFSAGQRPEQVAMPTPPPGVPPQLGLPGQPMGSLRQGQGGQPVGTPQVTMPMPRQVMPLQMGAPGQMGGMQSPPPMGMPGSSR